MNTKKKYIIGIPMFGIPKHIADYILQKEQYISDICKLTNKKENEIVYFLQQNTIDYKDLKVFCSVFGKLPNKNQAHIIYKSKSDPFYANFLAAHYLLKKEF